MQAALCNVRQVFWQTDAKIALKGISPKGEEVKEATSNGQGTMDGFGIIGEDPGLSNTARASIKKHKSQRQFQ